MDEQPSVTVALGDLQEFAEDLVRSGRYESLDHVIQDSLQALGEALAKQEQREDTPASVGWMRARVRESLDDPEPDVAADAVFERLDRKHAERVRASTGRAA